MSATAFMRGHPVEWDGSVWRHSDDGSPAPGWGGAERPCPKCGLISAGPDACLGVVPGLVSACCGHGVEEPYACPVRRIGWDGNNLVEVERGD